MSDKASLGRLRRSLGPLPRVDLEQEHQGQLLRHPRGIIDAKAEISRDTRAPQALDEEAVQQVLFSIQEAAAAGPPPSIAVGDIGAALRRTKAPAGMGVGFLPRVDLERLPDSGLAELASSSRLASSAYAGLVNYCWH